MDLSLFSFFVIGMATSTSGTAFAEIACLYDKDFSGIVTEIALIVISVFGTAYAGFSFDF